MFFFGRNVSSDRFESTILPRIYNFIRPIKSVTMATYVCRPHVIKTIKGFMSTFGSFGGNIKVSTKNVSGSQNN